jgi:hypothetical protein
MKKPEASSKYLLPPAKLRGSGTPKPAHRFELHLELYIHDDLVSYNINSFC